MEKYLSGLLGIACLFGMGIGAARAATPYLEYNFNDGAPTNYQDSVPTNAWAAFACPDGTGNGRECAIQVWGSSLGPGFAKVVSPLTNVSPNNAIRCPGNGGTDRIIFGSGYGAGITTPQTTFASGLSLRALVTIDAIPPGRHYIAGSPYTYKWDTNYLFGIKYVTTNLCLTIVTTSGTVDLNVPVSVIESRLNLGAGRLPGTPLVLMMTWNPANGSLNAFANGKCVGTVNSGTLAASLAVNDTREFFGWNTMDSPTTRAGTIDEIKLWQGPLTAAEVQADYEALVPDKKSPVPYLEWTFDDGYPTNYQESVPTNSWAVFSVPDMTGNNRGPFLQVWGTASEPPPGLAKVVSPLPSRGSPNYAIRWPSDAVEYDRILCGNGYGSGIDTPATTFSNGLSFRMMVSIDAYPGYYVRHPIAYSTSMFQLSYLTTDQPYLEPVLWTATGGADWYLPVTNIETKLHFGTNGLPGKPVVLMMIWSRAASNILVYANGQLVGGATNSTLAAALSSDTTSYVLLGNYPLNFTNARKSTFDEVKMWANPLTADEVMADYRTLVPIPKGAVFLFH